MFSIRSSLSWVADGLTRLYADYPLEPDDGFADFHVSVDPPADLRRWIRPQALFDLDGYRPFKPLPVDQAYAMLEWGMNWCVSSYFSHYLVVHAAVVAKEDRAAILPAPPGSGKSTLTAALIHRGWRLLSDELTLIDPRREMVLAMPRPVSLKNASIEIIRDFVAGAILSQVVKDTAKGTVAHLRAPLASVQQADRPARPAWIVFPKWQSGASAQFVPHAKGQTLLRIADNAFNYHLHGTAGFRTLEQMVERCECLDFSYGVLDDAIAAFDTLARETP